MSMLLEVEVEGERLSRDEVDAICYLLFLAGVDTVAAMLTFIANYLAQNQELYQKIKVDKEFWKKQPMNSSACTPSLISIVYVKPIRNFTVCSSNRAIISLFHHSLLTMMLRLFRIHNFNPERSKVERAIHHAFGDGPHKCIGMHLAKLEIKSVLEEFAKG